ncbi:MAG: hypothetical protein Q8L34_01860 [Candidatus Woesearchaeota archaeon]|nr:hypothetical protein [Candidatus Woesearchaeota archaeon]
MQKKKTSQQTFLLLSLIFVILLISFFSYQRLSGQAITDRSGVRAVSSPVQQQTGTTDSAVTGTGDLPDSDCEVDMDHCDGKCPCDVSVTCGVYGFIPGKTCNTGGVANLLKEFCKKVVEDTNKACLDSISKCEGLKPAHGPNYKCEGSAGVAAGANNNGQCQPSQVFEPEYNPDGTIRTRPDGTQVGKLIKGIILTCEASCPLYCSEVEI